MNYFQGIGLDISQKKVTSCQTNFSDIPNLSFERFNANNESHRRQFLEKWRNKVSLLTIFSSAHHLDDAPTCVKFFSDIMRDGGKIIALVPFQVRSHMDITFTTQKLKV